MIERNGQLTFEELAGEGQVQAFVRRSLANPNDCWNTKDEIAKDAVDWFKPQGVCLDPCRGDGAFFQFLPEGRQWCEIQDGRDFFDWQESVDWIISNPPYSIYTDFMIHAMQHADNIVWLLPIHKVLGTWGRVSACLKYGWIKHVRLYGGGRTVGYDFAFTFGAVHFQKGYMGATTWSCYA